MSRSKSEEIAEKEKDTLARRTFLGAAVVAGSVWAACRQSSAPRLRPGPQIAPDGPPLRAGLIGCGGRGTGAAENFLEAGPNLHLTAMADVFADRLEQSLQQLGEKTGVDVPPERRFVGFDAYRQLIDSDVDVVLLATPPHFRPEHFDAAVEARKQVFMEKPVAVDPAGVRQVLATAEKADAFQLNVVTGTQFRHQPSFIETYNRVAGGAIGDVLTARAYSLRGQLWYQEGQPEWTEMEAMLRDWVNWQWLSGDHIVEQHIHGLDVVRWFAGSAPVKAMATGGRMRRVTGDQYDFFNTDFELANGAHIQSMCRQIDGCTNNISRWVVGSEGYTNCEDTIFKPNGEVAWKYPKEDDTSPYVQEHIDLVHAIRSGERINEAAETAHSTLMAVMARMSAYTGKEVSWEEASNSSLRLGPAEYAFGPVDVEKRVPVPGT